MRTSRTIVAATAVAAAVASATSATSAPATAAPQRWAEQTFIINPTDGLFATHGGDLPLTPFPAGIARFTEPQLRTSLALGAKLRDSNGTLTGIATELETVLPDTDIPAGTLHSRTLWTLLLPGRGTITVDQFERSDDVAGTVFKHAIETGTPWVGNLTVRTTEGHTGIIVGGTDQFAGIHGQAAEIDHIYRFDPRTGELDTTIELKLRYRLTGGTDHPAAGRPIDRSFFAATPGDAVVLTHEGTMPIAPVPAGIPTLTEPELRTAFALGAKVRDDKGTLLGFTTELEYTLPGSDPATGTLRTRSLWTLFLPGRGSIIFDERENQDEFVRTVLKPALETGTPWVGNLTFTTTVRHTGVIVGGTGEFAGITGTAVEVGHLHRFDPHAGVLDGASEVRLHYRLPH
jgi:hypothetical protein